MPLPFSHVCDLLEQCSKLCAARQKHHPAVVSWFARHRALIDAHDTNVAALLSTLLPEKRTDRVYCIQATSLEKIIGRALMLGSSRMKELAMHKFSEQGVDLADCVERILSITPNPEQPACARVTVEFIDHVLHSLASRVKWSSPKVRNAQTVMTHETRGELEALYFRLSPLEAKWFTRLVLKNYEPLIFHSEAIYSLCDRALPSALKVLDDFVAAIEAVQLAKTRLLPNSSRGSISGHSLLSVVKPQHGIKVGRQPWLKGRSIKHCLDMGHGQMSVERKIDGEYCQIHIDLSDARRPLQIFSKSGKDSTEDRKKVHSVIMDSLRKGLSDWNIKQRCILEGELVVYSDLQRKIRPFHTIRNYVTRRGWLLNTEQDSQPKSYEHLMIVYYDILSVDDTSLLSARHSERRKHLERIIKQIPGRSELVSRQVIDFDHRLAASHLRKAFAAVIMQRGEGLVLKPDDPYFNFSGGQPRFASSCIKLKKEYIGTFGDVGDFAVVGAGFDPARAKSYKIPGLKWTHFYLGCLNNKEEVKRWGAKPDFTVVSIVEMNETQLRSFVAHGLNDTVLLAENTQTSLSLAPGLVRRPPLTMAFTQPPVVDLRCFSFDKEGNTGFWTPRFPGVSKIHFDRDFADTITFDELQGMAKDATGTPELEDSQENLAWIARLEGADPRGVAVDAMSQLTASSLATPSPRRRTQSISERGSPTSPSATRSQPIPGRALAMAHVTAIPLKLTRPAAMPLTPPTSSALQEPSSGSKSENSSKERAVNANASSPGSKRRRLAAAGPFPAVHQKSGRESHSRKPLGNIEGNSSQRSVTSMPSAVASQENPKVIIDLTTSSISSQTSTCSDMSSVADGNDSEHGQDVTSITIPEEHQDRAATPEMTNLQNAGTGRLLGDRPDQEQSLLPEASRCTFAGEQCRLAKMTTILAPYLANNEQISRRLNEHGVERRIFNLQAFTASFINTTLSGVNVLFLVDSVLRVHETEAVLDQLERVLDQEQRGSRPWVHVYDWRVLDNITISEDDGVLLTNFGGFSDPWRRWEVRII